MAFNLPLAAIIPLKYAPGYPYTCFSSYSPELAENEPLLEQRTVSEVETNNTETAGAAAERIDILAKRTEVEDRNDDANWNKPSSSSESERESTAHDSTAVAAPSAHHLLGERYLADRANGIITELDDDMKYRWTLQHATASPDALSQGGFEKGVPPEVYALRESGDEDVTWDLEKRRWQKEAQQLKRRKIWRHQQELKDKKEREQEQAKEKAKQNGRAEVTSA